jgi:hypothetical protein
MPRYKIIIHCFNLDVPDEESNKKIIGFFTTRYAEGATKEEAFKKVIKTIQKEENFKSLEQITKEFSQLTPSFEIEEIEKVSFYSGIINRNTGYTFYPAE